MNDICCYASRPVVFITRYVWRRPWPHFAILLLVLGAVGCSVTTQYAVKSLVDTLSQPAPGNGAWIAFAMLACLIASDCLLWRCAGWIASFTFVAVTGDLRRDLFRHLTGHAPSYFA